MVTVPEHCQLYSVQWFSCFVQRPLVSSAKDFAFAKCAIQYDFNGYMYIIHRMYTPLKTYMVSLHCGSKCDAGEALEIFFILIECFLRNAK